MPPPAAAAAALELLVAPLAAAAATEVQHKSTMLPLSIALTASLRGPY